MILSVHLFDWLSSLKNVNARPSESLSVTDWNMHLYCRQNTQIELYIYSLSITKSKPRQPGCHKSKIQTLLALRKKTEIRHLDLAERWQITPFLLISIADCLFGHFHFPSFTPIARHAIHYYIFHVPAELRGPLFVSWTALFPFPTRLSSYFYKISDHWLGASVKQKAASCFIM